MNRRNGRAARGEAPRHVVAGSRIAHGTRLRARGIVVLGTLFLATALVVAACSKSTSPGYGTSGTVTTGGGPTFDMHFPATGTSQLFAFTTAGTWDYHCTPHGNLGMTGTVRVDTASVNDSAVVSVGPGNTLTFSPSSVTIKPNGYVRWVNASTMTIHTVTRP